MGFISRLVSAFKNPGAPQPKPTRTKEQVPIINVDGVETISTFRSTSICTIEGKIGNKVVYLDYSIGDEQICIAFNEDYSKCLYLDFEVEHPDEFDDEEVSEDKDLKPAPCTWADEERETKYWNKIKEPLLQWALAYYVVLAPDGEKWKDTEIHRRYS